MIFGTPVEKSRPKNDDDDDDNEDKDNDDDDDKLRVGRSNFHPVQQVLVGQVNVNEDGEQLETSKGMTFNAGAFRSVLSFIRFSHPPELISNPWNTVFLKFSHRSSLLRFCHTMTTDHHERSRLLNCIATFSLTFSYYFYYSYSFSSHTPFPFMSFVNIELFLRVMSLCHTVVVEKDLDLPKAKDEETKDDEVDNGMVQTETDSEQHQHEQGPGGAPFGYAYQAESPDEGALVSESSETFGFQVLSRDSTGIKLKCNHPTLFRDEQLIEGLKTGKLDPKKVAADSVSGQAPVKINTRSSRNDNNNKNSSNGSGGDSNASNSIEIWSVLAINKFDSTRKRMSILLRSPPELGSAPILLCKGADSAMLDPEICAGSKTLNSVTEDDDSVISNGSNDSKWEIATTLGIQSHLGEFASEGLRTLVLGVRFLTEDQCNDWLEKYNAASTAIDNRDKKLTQAAEDIEKELHIVGATAIEDKLQVGVPDTIATLEDAGIKLWVLTGDKRETAVEIGYSTKVLTPQMHLTEFVDRGAEFVRAQCAMEFMRLVKAGKLRKLNFLKVLFVLFSVNKLYFTG
jgi:magnesium-transporting ATPase (P-type)